MPTVIDRVIQAIYLEAIDPIVEEQECKTLGYSPDVSSNDTQRKSRCTIMDLCFS